MFSRLEKRIPESQVQKALIEFGMVPRHWTAFSMEKIEWVLRHYQAIGIDWYYKTFDTNTCELIFLGPAELSSDGLPPGVTVEVKEVTRLIKG
jgi:hypothetical protein